MQVPTCCSIIARVINAPVAGPTGFIYCGQGRVFLEQGSTWQVATPTSRPPPIGAPSPHLEILMSIIIKKDDGDKVIPLGDVLSLDYERSSIYSGIVGDVRPKKLTGGEAHGILGLIDFEHPFYPPGIPAALITGRLTVTFFSTQNNGTRVEGRASFALYNDRLLRDETSDAYYSATDGLRVALALL